MLFLNRWYLDKPASPEYPQINNDWQLFSTSVKSLQLALVKCKAIGNKTDYSFTEQESLDSLTSKFNRVTDLYTKRVLHSVWMLLYEGFAPFIDMVKIMEKLNIIHSGEQLTAMRDLRNAIELECLPDVLIDFIPEVIHYSAMLDDNIRMTEGFLQNESGWISDMLPEIKPFEKAF